MADLTVTVRWAGPRGSMLLVGLLLCAKVSWLPGLLMRHWIKAEPVHG